MVRLLHPSNALSCISEVCGGMVISVRLVQSSNQTPQPTSAPAETPAPVQQSVQAGGNEFGSTLVVGNQAVVMINNFVWENAFGSTHLTVSGSTTVCISSQW